MPLSAPDVQHNLPEVEKIEFRADSTGTILFFNDFFAAMCGIAHPRGAPLCYEDFLSPQTARTLRERDARLLTSDDTPVQIEERWILADGAERWVRGWCGVWRSEQHTDRGVAFRGIDITACKQFEAKLQQQHCSGGLHESHQRLTREIEELARVEEELRDSEARYRFLANATHEGVVISRGGKVIDANDQFLAMFGYTRQEVLGAAITDFAVPEVRSEIARRIAEDMETPITHTALRKDGSRFEIEVHSRAIQYRGQPARMSAVRDITEHKRNEQALIQAERMAAVGTLVGGVAHQFNNINAAILGYAELLLRDGSLSEMARRSAQRIAGAVERAGAITEKLLRFSRPNRTDRFACDIEPVVRDALNMIGDDLAREGIDVDIRHSPTPCVEMNPGEIGQVLLNLLVNAKHALIDRDEKRIRIETGRDGERVFVRVIDNGGGISAENLPRIFSPFFTTKGEFAKPDSPQHRVRGTGLGLSVSNTIAQHHHGEITVETKEGSGSAFTLWLPVPEQIEDRDPASQSPPRPTAPLRVLVLDDEESIGDIIHNLMESEGHSTAWMKDGSEVLSHLANHPYDVILVDLQMPGMSGERFLHKLAELPPEQRPVPIILTGKAPEDVEIENTTVFDIIRKPFVADHLIERVTAAAALRRWNRQTDA